MSSSIIEADDLVKFYGGAKEPALDELKLRVPEGKIFTLLGRNGAGKTTFLRIASTQLLPTSGTVSVFGLDAINHPKEIRRRIAIAPQEAKPLWTLNAYDHVLLSLMMRGQSRAEAAKRAKHVIDAVELKDVEKVHSEELSGGMRQRILVAMAIACDVELLFLDEPTIGLDPLGRRRVWSELIRLKEEEGRSIVLTTHYMDEAEALSDELAIVEKGRVLVQGRPADVRAGHLKSKIRVDIAGGFTEAELGSYGKVIEAGNLLRLFVSQTVAEEISREALRRRATISIAPVTLDDVFVDIVGSSIEEDSVEKRNGGQEMGGTGR
ncbi:MAG: ABC transporter ATP-binding protein [Nitrososphaerales archaeon]|nr:ABC transporter ATP-binding protein [Nitrososphaerales archaeon]